MGIAKSKKEIFISQKKYIIDLLDEPGMLGCKPSITHIDPNIKLEKTKNSIPVDNGRYQHHVDRLIYLSPYKTKYCICSE